MVELLDIDGYTFDKEVLRLAIEEYERFRGTEDHTEEYKWETFEELNSWFEDNEITEDNVLDFVEFLQEENPHSGSFVHWSELDDLHEFANENPQKLSELFEELYDEEEDLEKRLTDFREETGIGTPAFGYLLAAHDRGEYAPIKVDRFRDFFDDFADQEPEKITGLSIPKRYLLYYEYCHRMAEFLEEEGVVEEATPLDAQDFYYTMETYEAINKESIFLKYIWGFSKTFNSFRSDSKLLFEEIKSLPESFLKERRDNYEDTDKVKKIRYEVLDEWLKGEDPDIEKIKEEVNSNYETDIIHSWDDFKIFGQIYVDFFKNRIKSYFENLAEYLTDQIELEGLEYHIVTFQGVQNFVTDKPWLLIYSEEKEDHRDSYQYFFRILPEKIEYGLSHGENIDDSEFEEKYVGKITEFDEIDLDNILETYNEVLEEFKELNKVNEISKEIQPPDDINIWQISPGKKDDNLWNICSKEGIIAIGWSETNDVNLKGLSIEDIGELLDVDNPRRSNDVQSLYKFANEMNKGDIIIAKKGKSSQLYGIGVVTGDYFHDREKMKRIFPEKNSSYDHFLPVNWIIDFIELNGERIEVDLNTGFVRWTLDKFEYKSEQNEFSSRWKELKEKLSDKNPEYKEKVAQVEMESKRLIESAEQSNEENYFWVTANPKRWKVSEIEEGGDVFYTAYNEKGNKRRVFEAFQKAKPGDKVLFYQSTPVKKVVAEGIITEGLHLSEEEGFEEPVEGISIEFDQSVRGISWNQITSIPDLEDAHPVTNRAQGSIFELTKEEYETILALEPEEELIEKSKEEILLEKNNADLDFDIDEEKIMEGLHFPGELKEDITSSLISALKSGKHIILTGPPGTGKTKLAKNAAEVMKENCDCVDDYIFTTATADWTTFDTMGGYQPSKEDGSLEFKSGQFLKCFKEDGKPVNKWLIIDEINRADIDKAFGQLFSVLSEDEVELPFTDEEEKSIRVKPLDGEINEEDFEYFDSDYYVTRNWRLLATMNTFDKASLYEMSYAFMRRFAFIDVGVPTEEFEEDGLMSEYIEKWDLEEDDVSETDISDLTKVWEVLNKGKRSIGPAIIKDMLMFLKEFDGEEGLVNALKLYVLPQLEGMVKQNQEKIFKELGEKIGYKEELEKVAKERFEIEIEWDENE